MTAVDLSFLFSFPKGISARCRAVHGPNLHYMPPLLVALLVLFLLSCCCCCCCFRKQPLRYNSVGARIDGLTPPGDYPAAETHYVIAESTGIVKPVQGQAVPMGTPV